MQGNLKDELAYLKADQAGCFWGQKCPCCLVGQSAKLSGGHMDVGLSTQSVYSCSMFPARKRPSVLSVLTLVNTSLLTYLQSLLSTLELVMRGEFGWHTAFKCTIRALTGCELSGFLSPLSCRVYSGVDLPPSPTVT